MEEIKGLQGILEQLYEQLLPQCSALIGVGRAIAGFAAIWFIGVRVWRHIARAEPVDVYPLLRPFVLGFMILVFPAVIALINGVMSPVVTGTGDLVNNTNTAISSLLQEQAFERTNPYEWYVGPDGSGNETLWEQYSGQADSGVFAGVTNSLRFAVAKADYNIRNTVRRWMSEVLQVLYQAAALTINTLRVFNLLVLAILGPLVFGLSVFDGFHHILTNWLARYLNIFLWLPVANIFGWLIGNIELQMLQLAHTQGSGASMGLMSTGYMVFMIMGIIGYFTVPSVAGYIVQVGGRGAHTLKSTAFFTSVVNMAAAAAGQAAGWIFYRARQGADNIWHAPGDMKDGGKMPGPGNGDYMGKKIKGSD